MKVLVISENIPKPDFSSGDRRFMGILEIMAQMHDVTFCIPNHQPWLKVEDNLTYIEGVEKIGVKFLPFNQGLFEQTIKQDKYDLVFFEFYWIAELFIHPVITNQPDAVIVVDSVDLHFAREFTQYQLGMVSKRSVKRTKSRELLVYRLADMVVAVSNEDKQILKENEKLKHVAFIPNIVPSVTRISKNRDPILLFIGCFAWPPNADGIIWFVKNVWPLILKENKNSRLKIVGSKPTDEILKLGEQTGIEVTGFVPDTAPYLDEAMISIAPLRYGGGMKGKVNEAMAHGLPVVATSIGAQGFNATSGRELIIADSPTNFAKVVLDLLKNPELRNKIGMAGRTLNENLCSPRVVRDHVNNMFQKSLQLNRTNSLRRKNLLLLKLKLNQLKAKYYWKFIK